MIARLLEAVRSKAMPKMLATYCKVLLRPRLLAAFCPEKERTSIFNVISTFAFAFIVHVASQYM